MPDQPTRVIQVGAGGFGHSWRRAIEENGCEVVALVDLKPDALSEAAEHFGLAEKACFAPDAAWDEVEADMIIDVTPHAHHRRNAERAFAKDRDVLVVKPMALDEADCYAMVEMAEERGRKLAVGQQLRLHPVIMKVRELVQSGAVGQLGIVHLDWFRQIPPPDDPPLFCSRGWSQPYPMLVEGAIHLFDYLRWITGYDPVSVWGQSFNLPWSVPASYGLKSAPHTCAYAQFEMLQPGCYAPLHVCFRSIATRLRQDSWLSHMQIEGDRGAIRIDSDRVYLNDEEVPVTWDNGRPIGNLQLDRLNSTIVRQFLDWRAGGPEPGFSGRNNLPSTGMVFGVMRSWQTGKRVAIRGAGPCRSSAL